MVLFGRPVCLKSVGVGAPARRQEPGEGRTKGKWKNMEPMVPAAAQSPRDVYKRQVLDTLLGKIRLHHHFLGGLAFHVQFKHGIHLVAAAGKQHLPQQPFLQIICLHMLPDALNQDLIHLGHGSVEMLAQIVQDHAVIAPLAEHLVGQAQKQVVLVKQVHQYGLGAVSYTHLDVYKRQHLCLTRFLITAVFLIPQNKHSVVNILSLIHI